MNKRILIAGLALAAAGCGGGEANVAANSDEANIAAEGGADLNAAIGGDELSPIPEAQDDMIANNASSGNFAAQRGSVGEPSAPPPPPVD